MADYVLTCCSSADLSKEHFEKRNIPVALFHFELDGVQYQDDMGETISPKELFDRMDAGATTKTSQISIGEYMEFWRPFLKEGKDILHVTLSSGISGTYQSALLAREDIKEEFPDRKIYILDSLAASSGYGLLVDTLADKRDQGADIDCLYAWAEDHKKELHHWFFSTDLTYFIRGGRVSKTAGVIGQVLSICPLLNVNVEGKLITREKIRTKKRTMKRTLEMMVAHAAGHEAYTGKCFISHSLYDEDTRRMADMIEETFKEMDGPVQIFPIGATIGSHTGPGTIAVFFWGDERKD